VVSLAPKVHLNPGTNLVNAQMTVSDPRLWWPVGYGEAALYQLVASVKAGGAEAQLTKQVGARKG
jgi:beta-mannosidase